MIWGNQMIVKPHIRAYLMLSKVTLESHQFPSLCLFLQLCSWRQRKGANREKSKGVEDIGKEMIVVMDPEVKDPSEDMREVRDSEQMVGPLGVAENFKSRMLERRRACSY